MDIITIFSVGLVLLLLVAFIYLAWPALTKGFDGSGLNGRNGLERHRIKSSGTVVPAIINDDGIITMRVSTGFCSDPGRTVRFKGTLIDEYYREYTNYGPEHEALALFKTPGGYRVWGKDTCLRGLNGITDTLSLEELSEEGYDRYWPDIISGHIEDLDPEDD